MMFAFLFLVFIGVAVGFWFHGAWKNCTYLICLILAGIIATNFFEPLSAVLADLVSGMGPILDFLIIWALFGVSFLILRFFCDLASATPVPFPKPAEYTLRSILCLWSAWIFVCFTAFTMHMAPLNSPNPLGAWSSPDEPAFLVLAPDRLWMGFAHSRSAGVLSRGNHDPSISHPDDSNPNVNIQPFDSNGDFIYKYRQRRIDFAKQPGIMQ